MHDATESSRQQLDSELVRDLAERHLDPLCGVKQILDDYERMRGYSHGGSVEDRLRFALHDRRMYFRAKGGRQILIHEGNTDGDADVSPAQRSTRDGTPCTSGQ